MTTPAVSKTPAIVSLLSAKNLRVIESFLRQHPGTTVLSPERMATPEAQARIAAAGGTLVSLAALGGALSGPAIAAEAAARQGQLVAATQTPAWESRWQGCRIPSAVLAECLAEEAATQLPSLIPLVAALQEAAARHVIRLVVLNEDLTPIPRVIVAWARRHGIPSLHLSHSLLLCEPYTVHALTHADVTAVYGKRGLDAYRDVGIDPARLRTTGNPAWDDYPQLAQRRGELRSTVAARYGLSAELPIVVFGTTWSANLTALGDEALYGKTVLAFLRACRELRDAGVAFQPVIKDRPTPESGPARLQQLVAEAGLPADFVHVSFGDPTEWVLAADVLIAVHSNLSVEAMLAGVPAINLLTELGLSLGPAFAPESGIVEAEEEALAPAVRSLLEDPERRARQLEAMKQAAPDHNVGADGRATERVVALMNELALPAQPPRANHPLQALLNVVDFVSTRYRSVRNWSARS